MSNILRTMFGLTKQLQYQKCALIIFRCASNSNHEYNPSNAGIIKQLNYENKSLFGAVLKPEKSNSTIKCDLIEDDKSSEIYWLVEHNSKKPIKNKKSETFKERKTKENVQAKRIKNKYNAEIVIPFTNASLKSILKFPMIASENKRLLRSGAAHSEQHYPSVTKILQATMSENSRKMLIKWKLSKLSELGEDGFNRLQADHLRKGKLFHEALQTYLTVGAPPDPNSEIINLWESVLPKLESLQPEVESTEIPVEHPQLKYRGIADCISRIGNEISVIEWKKSDRHKSSIETTYDAPIQLAAYLGALSADPRHNLEVKRGYVVVAYTDRKVADVHAINEAELRRYWDSWVQKVQEFWIRTRDGTLPEPI